MKEGTEMKKTWMMEDLDCAHCAMKMEEAIRRLPGVTSVSVNYLSARLTIEAEEADLPRLFKEAAAICKKIEPDCRLLP